MGHPFGRCRNFHLVAGRGHAPPLHGEERILGHLCQGRRLLVYLCGFQVLLLGKEHRRLGKQSLNLHLWTRRILCCLGLSRDPDSLSVGPQGRVERLQLQMGGAEHHVDHHLHLVPILRLGDDQGLGRGLFGPVDILFLRLIGELHEQHPKLGIRPLLIALPLGQLLQ